MQARFCFEKLNSDNFTIIHEFDSFLEIMEKNWFINFLLRHRSNLDNTLSDDSKVAFMSQDELMNIWSWTDSRTILFFLDGSDRGSNFDADNNVVNIAISVLFHAWGSGAYPSSQRTELDWVWFMSAHHSKFGKLFFHIFSDYTSFNTGHHVILVNPLYFVHSRSVDWNNCSFLLRVKHKRFSYVCSSSKWNQNYIVFFGTLNEVLSLFVTSYVYNVVSSSLKFWCSEVIQFLQGMSMWMENTSRFVSVDLIYSSLDSLNKCNVLNWWINRHLTLRLDYIVNVIDIKA